MDERNGPAKGRREVEIATNEGFKVRCILILFLLMPGLTGCNGKAEEDDRPRLEAIDVAPALHIDPADDQQAAPRKPALAGVLPQDFPNDLPLHLPASLIDFGSRNGSRYVSLLTAAPLARVDRELVANIKDKGWAASDGADGSKRLQKGGRQVRLRFEDARPGTLYHFEYR